MKHLHNDNILLPAEAEGESPDAHGLAALLLVESLLHGLLARSVLELEDAVEIVQVAVEVEMDLAADRKGSSNIIPGPGSAALLGSIHRSLKSDLCLETQT